MSLPRISLTRRTPSFFVLMRTSRMTPAAPCLGGAAGVGRNPNSAAATTNSPPGARRFYRLDDNNNNIMTSSQQLQIIQSTDEAKYRAWGYGAMGLILAANVTAVWMEMHTKPEHSFLQSLATARTVSHPRTDDETGSRPPASGRKQTRYRVVFQL